MKCLTIILLLCSQICFAQVKQTLKDRAVYPKAAIAIHKWESGHGRSKLAVNHNNMFGFKYRASTRKTGHTKSGYNIYESKLDSVEDYLEFEQRIIEEYNIKTVAEYLRQLKKFYASDKSWYANVKLLMKTS